MALRLRSLRSQLEPVDRPTQVVEFRPPEWVYQSSNRLIPRWGSGLGANGLHVSWLVLPSCNLQRSIMLSPCRPFLVEPYWALRRTCAWVAVASSTGEGRPIQIDQILAGQPCQCKWTAGDCPVRSRVRALAHPCECGGPCGNPVSPAFSQLSGTCSGSGSLCPDPLFKKLSISLIPSASSTSISSSCCSWLRLPCRSFRNEAVRQ
jgi:hypothetical protein